MADLAKHACKHGAFLLLARAADLAQAERPQRAPVALALPNLAPYLGDLHLCHLRFVLLPAQTAPLRLLLGDGLGRRLGHGLLDDRCRWLSVAAVALGDSLDDLGLRGCALFR